MESKQQFLRLTGVEGQDTLINISHIVCVQEHEKGSAVHSADDGSIIVIETPEQIMNGIMEA